jgi:hypothetical protein
VQRVFPNHRIVYAETPEDFKEYSVDDALAILCGKGPSSQSSASDVKFTSRAVENMGPLDCENAPVKDSSDVDVDGGADAASEPESVPEVSTVENMGPLDCENAPVKDSSDVDVDGGADAASEPESVPEVSTVENMGPLDCENAPVKDSSDVDVDGGADAASEPEAAAATAGVPEVFSDAQVSTDQSVLAAVIDDVITSAGSVASGISLTLEAQAAPDVLAHADAEPAASDATA